MNDVHVQQAANLNGPTNSPMQTAKGQHPLHQQPDAGLAPALSLSGQHRIMPKNVTNNFQYQPHQAGNQLNHHHHHQHHHNVPTSHQVPLKTTPQISHQHHQHHHQAQQVTTQLGEFP